MIQNAWYVAVPSSRLSARPVGTRVLEEDLVVFRGPDGRARALLDRCAHRGVKLSLGRCEQGGVVCPYHGWRYDGEGVCQEIPSLSSEQRIPAGVRVPTRPCVEQDGYVWVWMGAADAVDGAPLPIFEYDRHRWVQGTIPMDCPGLRAIENSVDPTHAAFAHPWTHPQWFRRRFVGLSEGSLETRVTERGMLIFAPATADEDASGPVPDDVFVTSEFELPDRVTVVLAGRFRQVIVLHMVPTGESTCRLEYLVRSPLPFGPKLHLAKREPRILRQDRVLMESAQSSYEREGPGFERSVAADFPMILARRIHELAVQGQFEDKRAALPQRRVTRLVA